MSAEKIAKPVMRGLLHKRIRTHLSIAIGLTISVGIATRVLLGDKRKETYKNFYMNYDIEKDFEEMRQKGVFQSAQ